MLSEDLFFEQVVWEGTGFVASGAEGCRNVHSSWVNPATSNGHHKVLLQVYYGPIKSLFRGCYCGGERPSTVLDDVGPPEEFQLVTESPIRHWALKHLWIPESCLNWV